MAWCDVSIYFSLNAMTLISALTGFATIAFLITIIPGTDTALVLRSLTAYGRRAAYAAVFGVTCGLLVWGVAAATGLAVLMEKAPGVFEVITIAGGLYLIYLGLSLLKNLREWGRASSLKTTGQDAGSTVAGGTAGIAKSFRTGFVANILNPKIAIFYIASVPPFMVDSVPSFLMGSYLALIHGGINVLWFTLIIVLVALAKKWLAHPRATLVLDGVAGAVFTCFGISILGEMTMKLL